MMGFAHRRKAAATAASTGMCGHAGMDLFERESAQTYGGQLDRQWHPVQAGTQLGHDRCVVRSYDEIRHPSRGSVLEQDLSLELSHWPCQMSSVDIVSTHGWH